MGNIIFELVLRNVVTAHTQCGIHD